MTSKLIKSLLNQMVNAVVDVNPVLLRAMNSGMVDWRSKDKGPKEPTGEFELKDADGKPTVDEAGKPVMVKWAPWVEQSAYSSTLVAAGDFMEEFSQWNDEQREMAGQRLVSDFGGSYQRAAFKDWLEGADYIEQHYPPVAFRFWAPPGTKVAASLSCPAVTRGTVRDERTVDEMGFIDVEPMPKWNIEVLEKWEQAKDVVFNFTIEVGPTKIPGTTQLRMEPIGVAELGLPAGLQIAAYVNENHPWVKSIISEARGLRIADSLGFDQNDTMASTVRQVYAVWHAFRNRDLSYVSIAEADGGAGGQVVRFFHESIEENGANCADGSAAFASVLMALGFDVHLCFVPGHVFIGVPVASSAEWLFIETTMLGDDAPDPDSRQFDEYEKKIPAAAMGAEWDSFERSCEMGHSKIAYSDSMIVSINKLRGLGLKPISIAKSAIGKIPSVPALGPVIKRRSQAQMDEAFQTSQNLTKIAALPGQEIQPYLSVTALIADIEKGSADLAAMIRLLRSIDGYGVVPRCLRSWSVFWEQLAPIDAEIRLAFPDSSGALSEVLYIPPVGAKVDNIPQDGDKHLLRVNDQDGNQQMSFLVQPVHGGYAIDIGQLASTEEIELLRELVLNVDFKVLQAPTLLQPWINASVESIREGKFKSDQDAWEQLLQDLYKRVAPPPTDEVKEAAERIQSNINWLMSHEKYDDAITIALAHSTGLSAQNLNALAWDTTTKLPANDPRRDLARAQKWAEQAVKMSNRQDSMILDTLARVYWEQGDHGRAIDTQREVVTLINRIQRADDSDGMKESNAVRVARLKQYEEQAPDLDRAPKPNPAAKRAPPPANEIQVVDTVVGNGAAAEVGDTVEYLYTLKLDDGTVVFTATKPNSRSAGAGKTAPIGLNRGLVGCRAGGKRLVTVPPALGYGADGLPKSKIPGNATLHFEIEVISVSPAK